VRDADAWRVDLDLWVEDGRTVLRFVQILPAAADVTDMATGWHWYRDELGAEASGRPQPTDWDTFIAGVGQRRPVRHGAAR
jgi:hypothetical protein